MKKGVVKLPEDKSILWLMLITWLTYFSTYFGRLNFSASLSEMSSGGGFPKAELGAVAASFFLSYGFSQIFSGILGDRFSPRLLVLAGMACSAIANGVFPFCINTGSMTVVWFLNGLAQAFIWAPMSRYIADRTSGAQYIRIVLLLSTTGPAGMFCAYGVCAILLRSYGWQSCFWMAFIVLLAAALIWLCGTMAIDRYAARNGIIEKETDGEKVQDKKRKGSFWGLTKASGFLWIAVSVCLHGLLKDGLNTWIPTYLAEVFAITPSFSLTLTMILPISNLSGVYLANRLNLRFRNEVKTAAIFFLCAFIAIIGMMFVGSSTLAGVVLLFAVVTSAMTAVNTIFISVLPVHFRQFGVISTVSGMLNATTYVGSACSSVLFGYLAQDGSWQSTQIVWGGIALLGIACCITAKKKWSNFRRDLD